MDHHQQNVLRTWVLRILGWDAILPGVIWVLPLLIRVGAPQIPQMVEIVAVLLPIIAFFVRFRAGRWHISTNGCGRRFRFIQFVALCFGIFVLVIVDAVIILTHNMPKGALGPTDIKILAGVYSFNLACMILALYPGVCERNAPAPPYVE